MCFLRCDTAHHRLAILTGPASLNHVSFEVRNVDELMRGIARLHRSGVTLEWGPGRHTAGNNVFSYFRTPGGTTVEYTAELEHVDADWQPSVYPLTPEVTDQWGTGRVFISGQPHFPQAPDAGLWTPPPL
jgi:2,3-dihydroxy-p-cumate/2,3-dihydroxybenzoate 3,4-dioxygenase